MAGAGSEGIYDKIWSMAKLYESKENPVLEEFSLASDFFIQWAHGSSSRGSYGAGDLPASSRWGDTDVRVWRLGFRAQVFQDFKLTALINVNPDWNPLYRDIYDLTLVYAPDDTFNLGIGKQKGKFFSQEYSLPTRELIVFDQALLVNTLIPRGVTGAWVNGKAGSWIYSLAGYAGDYQKEFSDFNAGAVIQAQIGYDFAQSLKVEKAVLRFDYQNSTSSRNSFGPGKFSHAFSLNTTLQNGRFYGYADVLGGIGTGSQGDVWGVVITPTWFVIAKTLQLVLRYQYAHGDNNGLKLGRYESLAPGLQDTKGTGGSYNAASLGLNWYLHGHKLKLMTAVEYNELAGGLKDFAGWTYLAGVRLAF